MKPLIHLFALAASITALYSAPPQPLVESSLVFAESGGLVAVEAEHFFQQEKTAKRAWYVFSPTSRPRLTPDTDGTHLAGASGGAYLEVLPDSRWSHDEKLIDGENFSREPGRLAVLSYKVHFSTPGRYHFWARVYSTGAEDNGFHVGLDGTWPESGQRWQTTMKNAWSWDSRQRTDEVHNGVPGQLFLDVPTAGEHLVQISMREDGLEMDKWLMSTDPNFVPQGLGPEPRPKSGRLPPVFAAQANQKEDAAPSNASAQPSAAKKKSPSTKKGAASSGSTRPTEVLASSLDLGSSGFYLDDAKWAAVDPEQRQEAAIKFVVPVSNGRYRITLHAVGENDGSSIYEVYIAGNLIGRFECPLSNNPLEEGERYTQTWHGIDISEGTLVEVRARAVSRDGQEWSRGRWLKIVFEPTGTGGGGHGEARLALAREQREKLFRPVARQPHGDGTVRITGDTRQWHKVTVELAGPFAAETDTAPNPFTDYRYDVTFQHESGSPTYTVPGYFAVDGRAAETSATAGTTWRAHLAPDRPGRWTYRVAFTHGKNSATYGGGAPLAPFDGRTGSFTIAPSNKSAPDFRAEGRLIYNGGHYLIRAGSGRAFLKAGADAPETLLAYADFDDTLALKREVPLKTWEPHLRDWKAGDPSWKGGKGKGLIGAVNYLAGRGVNAISFLTYNAAGDGDNIWPFVARDEKLHYDCSRLDQWAVVFEHAQARGVFLHFKLQENENDDHRAGARKTPQAIPEALDGGATGPERRLYFREMIARFGHNLGLNWNLGEENTQTPAEQRAMANYIRETDPYDHLLVIHSFPEQQDEVYQALLGRHSELTGASAQNSWKAAHQQTLRWVRASAAAGRPWVVCNDEQNPANQGVPPDPGYQGFNGKNKGGNPVGYDLHDIRKATLWGTFMAGGAGVEYYFGYALPENDLLLEDFRSRDQSWSYCRIALEFFDRERIPLTKMKNADELVGNAAHDNSVYCLAETNACYLIYLPAGGSVALDLSAASGEFSLAWLDPRAGGTLRPAGRVSGGSSRTLTAPTTGDDWLAVLRR